MEYFVLILALVLFGGFHMFGVMLVGAAASLGALLSLVKGRPEKAGLHGAGFRALPEKWQFYIPHLCLLIATLMLPFAENKDTAFQGILRGIVILVWMHMISLAGEEKREKLLSFLPNAGVIICLAGVLFLPFPVEVSEWMWLAGRFCGTFQYANTNALFLAVCIIILLKGITENETAKKVESAGKSKAAQKLKKSDIVKLVILMAGLLATGTRSVLLLLLCFFIYRAVRNRAAAKTALILAGVIVAVSALSFGASALVGSDALLQNAGRLATIFKYNSTLYGRLLYWRDAVLYLLKHPWGLGYLGYYDAQGLFQTGNYTTMFVHNDLLQLGVDFGIAPMLLMAYYFYYQLRHGRQGIFKKEILVFMALSSLVDFHFQYEFIIMLAVLLIDSEREGAASEKTKVQTAGKDKNRGGINVFMTGLNAVLCLVFVYFTVAFLSLWLGNYDLTLSMYGASTEALEAKVMTSSDAGEIEELTAKVSRIKKHSFVCENVGVYMSLMNGDEEGLLSHMEGALSLDPYDEELYASYAQLYPDADEFLREKSKEQKTKTTSLAYKLRDKPYFYGE